MADDCACEGRIRPRSALMTTPKATEAMMIAIVDRMRLVVGFMTVEAPLKRSIDIGGGPFCTAALDVPAGAAWRRMCLRRTRPRNVSWPAVTRYEQHSTPLKRSFRHQKVGFDAGVVVEIGANQLAYFGCCRPVTVRPIESTRASLPEGATIARPRNAEINRRTQCLLHTTSNRRKAMSSCWW